MIGSFEHGFYVVFQLTVTHCTLWIAARPQIFAWLPYDLEFRVSAFKAMASEKVRKLILYVVIGEHIVAVLEVINLRQNMAIISVPRAAKNVAHPGVEDYRIAAHLRVLFACPMPEFGQQAVKRLPRDAERF